ncbi:type II toxin-antitoxin system RelB family antitoxin [Brucella sp. IR073]|uniref:type II toxin-antitoxin system RelB family antitoxin n=1 Tax=unclassified Brucella TaxID=2632610 RepID=UPI003B97D8EF
MSKHTAIRLPEETLERLEALSAQTGHPTSFHIREALDEYLTEMEDVYRAEKTLERIRAGQEQVSSLNEVEKRLSLAD